MPILAEQNIEGEVAVPRRGTRFHPDLPGRQHGPQIMDGDLVAVRSQPEVENRGDRGGAHW